MKYKIFPRNLTARADYLVPGNPTNSRPEAGVDNCYPGLEFDQRNLDERFFPGLTFYYHRGDGARLIGLQATAAQAGAGLAAADLVDPPLYLWGMLGRHLVEQNAPSTVSFQAQSGMEVWRRVHDLLPGPVAIVFGAVSGLAANLSDDLRAALSKAYAAAEAGEVEKQFIVKRDSSGKLIYAVYADQRASYLTPDGVIDPAAYPPGELTKTMCAPWMYDFRDCYCFYWSSNKPDIVNVPHEGGTQDYVNFLRRVQDRVAVPPADVDYYRKTLDGKLTLRRELELTYKDMVEGWSQRLPVVLNDTESPDSIATPLPPCSPLAREFTLPAIIAELSYLATVEHALTVEYLYAYYSINATAALNAASPTPGRIDPNAPRIAAAANQVFQIAVDEMRHLMWANIGLCLLGAPASVGRAARIAEPPSGRDGRVSLQHAGVRYLDQPFALNRLDAATLDWFIQVEAPSNVINEGLDGMYVYILEALRLYQATIPNADRLIPLIKLIVEEGRGHWERFSRVKATLDGIDEATYLHPLAQQLPTPEQEQYLDICDSYYQLLLKAIEISVTLGEAAQSQLVGAAVRMMMSLDEMAVILAAQGYLPRFTLPLPVTAPKSARLSLAATAAYQGKGRQRRPARALMQLESIYGRLERSLRNMSEGGTPEARLRVARHRQQLAQHVVDMDRILLRDLTESPTSP
jgi:hypothetical protein